MKLSGLGAQLSEEFVRRVLEKMHAMRREFDEPHVRIAVGSEGPSPDYEIASIVDDQWIMISFGFRGKTHREMPDEVRKQSSWHDEHMTLAEVAELRQTIRNRR